MKKLLTIGIIGAVLVSCSKKSDLKPTPVTSVDTTKHTTNSIVNTKLYGTWISDSSNNYLGQVIVYDGVTILKDTMIITSEYFLNNLHTYTLHGKDSLACYHVNGTPVGSNYTYSFSGPFTVETLALTQISNGAPDSANITTWYHKK